MKMGGEGADAGASPAGGGGGAAGAIGAEEGAGCSGDTALPGGPLPLAGGREDALGLLCEAWDGATEDLPGKVKDMFRA
jgi:hypothetical protein